MIKKYVLQDQLPELLSEFCKTSGVTIDDYYQALKYPEGTKGKVYSHFPLKYQGKSGLQFFEILKIDLKKLVKEAVKLSWSICPEV